MQVLLPGDSLPVASTSTAALHLGPGLTSSTSTSSSSAQSSTTTTIAATRAGLLGHLAPQTGNGAERYWIESRQYRYTPSPPEPVLGIVTARHAEGYRVDIGASQPASLDALAFEGATKRNKPNLKVLFRLSLSFPVES